MVRNNRKRINSIRPKSNRTKRGDLILVFKINRKLNKSMVRKLWYSWDGFFKVKKVELSHIVLKDAK